MLAFHNDPEIKEFYLERIRRHRRADEIVQGYGFSVGENGKLRACGIGCTLDVYDHSRYPIELGIPLQLAYLEDRIFESLSHADAMAWPLAFLEDIPLGADLLGVWPQAAIWCFVDEKFGVRRHAAGYPAIEAAIDMVVGLYREVAPPNDPRWQGAGAKAAAGAGWAEAGWAEAGRRGAFWHALADELLRLLAAAPVGNAAVPA